MRRSPSAIRSLSGGTCGLLPSDASEHRSDRHAKPRQVAFADDIAGHDFSGREEIGIRSESQDLRSRINPYTKVCERYSRPQWISKERRLVDGLRPMRFRGVESFGAAIIEDLMVEVAGP